MPRQNKRIVVALTPDEWKRLEAAAAADERDPWMHARYLVMKGLKAAEADLTDESTRALEAS